MSAVEGNRGQRTNHRQVFTSYEDARLKLLVQQYGVKNWDLISYMMPNRTPRQCRERYKGHLAPEILNLPWTPQEDRLLIEKYTIMGRKWSKIAKFFVGRSDSNIKNRWQMLLQTNKQVQELNQRDLPSNEADDAAPSIPDTPDIESSLNIANLTNPSKNSTEQTNQPVHHVVVARRIVPDSEQTSSNSQSENVINIQLLPNMFWNSTQSDTNYLSADNLTSDRDSNINSISMYKNYGGKVW